MRARAVLEAETAKRFLKRVAEPQRKELLKFKSKDEVNIGTRVLYRSADYGFKGNFWDEANDRYYGITGSDHHRVDGFYSKGGMDYVKRPKEQSTHVSLHGVSGPILSWKEFFERCVKPEYYYPGRNLARMAFEVPPDQRD